MNDVGIILLVSVLILPAAALVALGWAGRHGQLAGADRAALLPFDEAEPVGQMTDGLFHRTAASSAAADKFTGTSISPTQA